MLDPHFLLIRFKKNLLIQKTSLLYYLRRKLEKRKNSNYLQIQRRAVRYRKILVCKQGGVGRLPTSLLLTTQKSRKNDNAMPHLEL
jgi:hypothetical protein